MKANLLSRFSVSLIFLFVQTTALAKPQEQKALDQTAAVYAVAGLNSLTVKQVTEIVAQNLPSADKAWWANEIKTSFGDLNRPMPQSSLNGNKYRIELGPDGQNIKMEFQPELVRIDGTPYEIKLAGKSFREGYAIYKKMLAKELSKKHRKGAWFSALVTSAYAGNLEGKDDLEIAGWLGGGAILSAVAVAGLCFEAAALGPTIAAITIIAMTVITAGLAIGAVYFAARGFHEFSLERNGSETIASMIDANGKRVEVSIPKTPAGEAVQAGLNVIPMDKLRDVAAQITQGIKAKLASAVKSAVPAAVPNAFSH